MEDYVTSLGKLIGNLHSLEMALRAHLGGLDESATQPFSPIQLENLHPGIQLPENAFTNFDSLAKLIRKFNCSLSPNQLHLAVETGLVDLRDAIAHGRVFAKRAASPMFLIKFTRPKEGRVEVAFAAKLTPNWLMRQRKRVARSIQNIRAAGGPAFPIGNNRPCPASTVARTKRTA